MAVGFNVGIEGRAHLCHRYKAGLQLHLDACRPGPLEQRIHENRVEGFQRSFFAIDDGDLGPGSDRDMVEFERELAADHETNMATSQPFEAHFRAAFTPAMPTPITIRSFKSTVPFEFIKVAFVVRR